jgi:hypothetical protein
MDRYGQIIEDDEDSDSLLLTGEDIETILRALDSYGYAMVMSQSMGELQKIKRAAEALMKQLPRTEFDS